LPATPTTEGGPPNQRLELTGAAVSILRNMAVLQAAPAAELVVRPALDDVASAWQVAPPVQAGHGAAGRPPAYRRRAGVEGIERRPNGVGVEPPREAGRRGRTGRWSRPARHAVPPEGKVDRARRRLNAHPVRRSIDRGRGVRDMPAGIGIPVSKMTNRQLMIAVPMVFVICAGNICLVAGAFALEWSGGGRLWSLLGYAPAVAFFAAFLVYWEIAFLREVLKRWRARPDRVRRTHG
jgi:hypothetical protein